MKAITDHYVTNPNSKRTIWRGGLAFRRIRYAGAIRLVPAMNEGTGKQWVR